MKAFETVDQVEAELNALATKIMADPRRIAAIQQDCSNRFADVQHRAQAAETARQILDPAHNGALLANWLAKLPEATLADVENAATAEKANRKKLKAKQPKA